MLEIEWGLIHFCLYFSLLFVRVLVNLVNFFFGEEAWVAVEHTCAGVDGVVHKLIEVGRSDAVVAQLDVIHTAKALHGGECVEEVAWAGGLLLCHLFSHLHVSLHAVVF